MKRRAFLKLCGVLPFLPKLLKIVPVESEPPVQPRGTMWFLDAEHGDDAKDGLTPETALRSLSEVFKRMSDGGRVVARAVDD